MPAERSLEGPDPSPPSAPPPRSSGLPGEAVRDLQAENQAKVSGWGKGFGIGQKLARVCDSGVLQGAAEMVQFDGKGLFPTAPPRLSQVRVGGRCKWWPCTHRGRAVANRCEKNRIRPTLFSEIRAVRFNPSGEQFSRSWVVKKSADSYRNGRFQQRSCGSRQPSLSGALSQSIYYAKNIAAATAGANVVNVTFTSPASYPDIRISCGWVMQMVAFRAGAGSVRFICQSSS